MKASVGRRRAFVLGIAVVVLVGVASFVVRGSGDRHDDGDDMLAGAKDVETICRLLDDYRREENRLGSISAPSVLASYQAVVATATAAGATRFADTAQDALRELAAISTMTSIPTDVNSDTFADIYQRTLRARIDIDRMRLACAIQGAPAPRTVPTTTQKN